MHVNFLVRKENFVKSYLIVQNFRTAQKGEIIVFYTKSMIWTPQSMISKIMFFLSYFGCYGLDLGSYGSFWVILDPYC